MTPLEKIKQLAQHEANGTGKPVLILNLDRYQPLYVIRDFDERLLFSDFLVAVIEPQR